MGLKAGEAAPARWERLKRLFAAALDLEEGKRAAFLAEACGGDDPLREEVEALLASHREAGSFIEAPAGEWLAAAAPAEEATPLVLAGDRLGPYEVRELLGSGGMGEVYRARDARLGRDIAIKVLPARSAQDPARLRLFEQEARAASALNHPNIVTVHDVGSFAGRPYLTMEWVRGRTLREMLAAGPLPLGEGLRVAAQLGDGLAKAHLAGIVHRDLKPENVMVTEDGLVKVLDFGLAKLAGEPVTRSQEGVVAAAEADTVTRGVVGTIGYFSPEQTRGGPVDFRSDQFAVGAILYEMFTGRRAFPGDSPPEVLSAILGQEPTQPAGRPLPPALWKVVQRCLAKDPARRYGATRELADALETLRLRASQGLPLAGRRRSAAAAIVVATLVALVAIVVAAFPRRPGGAPIDSVAVLPIANVTGDQTQDYLSDGLTDRLIGRLSEKRDLRVLARSSAFRYRDAADPREAGRQLEVRSVVVGRLSREDGRLRLEAELVDVASGARLWGGRFDRLEAHLAGLEEEVSQEILARLRPQGSASPAVRARATDPRAYELYLRGRYLWNKRTLEGLRQGRELFEQAVARDPQYAAARSGIADCYIAMAWYGVMPAREALARAREAALAALGLDDGLAEAHTSLAFVALYGDWDWARAESGFRRAVELNPNYVTAHHWYGYNYLRDSGRYAEAIAALKRALELDPLSLTVNAALADVYTDAGQPDMAVRQSRRTLDIDPSFFPATNVLGWALEEQGDLEGAVAVFRKSASLAPVAAPLVEVARLQARRGRLEEARRIRRSLARGGQDAQAPPLRLAQVELLLGRREAAVSLLETAYEDRSLGVLSLPRYRHRFEALRGEPRFESLLARIPRPPSG